jgi:hypothetical protein
MRNPSFFAFFRSASDILDVVQPVAYLMLESFAIRVCCESHKQQKRSQLWSARAESGARKKMQWRHRKIQRAGNSK